MLAGLNDESDWNIVETKRAPESSIGYQVLKALGYPAKVFEMALVKTTGNQGEDSYTFHDVLGGLTCTGLRWDRHDMNALATLKISEVEYIRFGCRITSKCNVKM